MTILHFFFLINFTLLLGQRQLVWAMSGEEAKCARETLLADAQKAIDNMSAEELKAALEKYRAIEEQKALDARDTERVERLAQLLLLIEKKGKVKIENCTELTIKEKSPEATALLEEIKSYCKNSPQDVWAEITKTGQIKLTFAHGENNGIKTVTLGGGGALTLGYHGHTIKLGGNITTASIAAGNATTSSFKYDHLVDYSIDLGIKNLETFLKWQGTFESTRIPSLDVETEAYIRRNVVDLGLRYNIFQTDQILMKMGIGLGGSYLDQMIAGALPESVLSPSTVVTTDFSYKPSKSAELFVNTRLQQDFLTEKPRTVAGFKAGGKMSFGPVGAGVEYGSDYDDVRTGTKLNHQFMANIFASVDPSDWKSEKQRKEVKEARERERILWEQTLERIREISAEEEKKKKEKTET